MNKFNKSILAAALMVAAGSANAALTQGEAFLVAFDAGYVNTDGSLGRTYNLDLGTTFTALKSNAATALAAYEVVGGQTLDANWTAFRTGGTDLITYGVYAAGSTNALGVFETGVTAMTSPAATARTTPAGSTTTWGSALTQINRQASEITGTSSVVLATDAPASGQADSVPSFASLWGGAFTNAGIANNPTVAYGSTADFWYGGTHIGTSRSLANVTTSGVVLLAQSDIASVGQFTLAGNTLAFTAPAAVPLPAAVWMFGAGLMGVLRLNRRKSVQA